MHVGYGTDEESGTRVSLHLCDTCNREFTLCPAVDPDKEGWENCLYWSCKSYDVKRDLELSFITGNTIIRIQEEP